MRKKYTERQYAQFAKERLDEIEKRITAKNEDRELVAQRGYYKFCKETEKALGFFETKNKVVWFPKSVIKAIRKKIKTNRNGVEFETFAVYLPLWYCDRNNIFYNGGMLWYLDDVIKEENCVFENKILQTSK